MSEKIDKSEYAEWVASVKRKIQKSRADAVVGVNIKLMEMYWDLGREICAKQKNSGWGARFMEKLAVDLRREFPDMKGFSRRNLYAVRQWYLLFSEAFEFVPQAVAQIPWGHNRLIISKADSAEEALFYARECASGRWNRDVLEQRMESCLYQRSGLSSNNFPETLDTDRSEAVSQTLKDPYVFDFLSLREEALEREIEDELVKNISDFLLELGKGFAYVGRQYKIEVSDRDYFLDLLFYNIDLRCYVVIELKAGRFKPEYAGKLNFYLSAVDSQMKRPEDNPSIGILLCRKKDGIEVEYSLRGMQQPIGVSEYKIGDALPEKIKSKLPSIDELEEELARRSKK